MNRLCKYGLVLVLLTAPFAAFSASVVDVQSSPPFPFGAVNGWSQSFQAADNNVSGAGLAIFSSVNGTGTLTINLESALNGPVLASATGTLTFPSGINTGFYDLLFSTPVEVTTGSTLFLSWSASLPGADSLRAGNDTYANGQLYAGTIPLPNFDMGFRVYTDTSFTPGGPGPGPGPTPVPEPASLALLSGGLLACFAKSLKSRLRKLRAGGRS